MREGEVFEWRPTRVGNAHLDDEVEPLTRAPDVDAVAVEVLIAYGQAQAAGTCLLGSGLGDAAYGDVRVEGPIRGVVDDHCGAAIGY